MARHVFAAAALLAASCAAAAAEHATLSQRGRRGGGHAYSEAATLHRMQYWSPQVEPKALSDKYLLFTLDHGGLNNIRIGWEIAGLIAQHTGRTFVLPPATAMYLLDYGPRNEALLRSASDQKWSGKTAVEDLINLGQLKGMLPTVTAEEFEAQTGISWSAALLQAEQPTQKRDPTDCRLTDYDGHQGAYLFLDGKQRRPFECGEWWLRGAPRKGMQQQMAEKDWALLRHGFVWHPDAFDIASKVVHFLGPFEYMALHARFGDFAETQAQSAASSMLQNWEAVLDNTTSLYVATDRQDEFEGTHFKKPTVMWPDLFTEKTGNVLVKTKTEYTPERWFKLTGLVEELICTYGKVFVGTDRSSFSGHIERMRVHADPPVRMRLVHTRGDPGLSEEERVVKPDVAAIQEEASAWEDRAWSPKPPTVGDTFLQTASKANHRFHGRAASEHL